MNVLYDHQAFDIQNYGGVSNYFYSIISQFNQTSNIKYNLKCTYSNNEYLLSDNLFKIKKFLPSNQFVFKQQIMHFLNKPAVNRILKTKQFDIFHPTYYNTYFLKNIGNKPFVLTIHDMIHEILPQYFSKNDTTSHKKKLLAQKASKIIAVSENTKIDIIKYYQLDENKIEVIYHGSPLMGEKCSNIVKSLPEKYILYVGSRGAYKNFKTFINAISEFLINQNDLYLVCAGGGNFSVDEKKMISKLGINQKVKYHSATADVLASVYSLATCFCFPTLYEGFGFPTLEAFGCGCPVALSNSSSLPEVGGDAAEYFDPTCPQSIKFTIDRVLKNKSLRKEMRAKGLERSKEFTWAKTATQTMKIYTSIV